LIDDKGKVKSKEDLFIRVEQGDGDETEDLIVMNEEN